MSRFLQVKLHAFALVSLAPSAKGSAEPRPYGHMVKGCLLSLMQVVRPSEVSSLVKDGPIIV